MSPPAPAKKHAVIQIQERLAQGAFAEIDFFRFEKLAREEMKSPKTLANGLSALGILACLRGDEQGMREYHQRAISVTGGDLTQVYNFASSLNHCRKHAEALALAEDVYAKDPLSLDALSLIIRALYHLGRIQEAFSRLHEWDAKAENEHPFALDIAEDIDDEEAVRLAREEISAGNSIPWESIKAELGL